MTMTPPRRYTPAYKGGPSIRRRSGPQGTRTDVLSPADAHEHFSYAAPDDGPVKRRAIRAIEHLTGQPKLHSMYLDYRTHHAGHELFWDAAMRYLALDLRYDRARLNGWPSKGPLVVVSNHPFGVVDGLTIGHLVGQVRRDFLILTNSVLFRAEEARDHLLPIDFSDTQAALQTNLETRKRAKEHLRNGGCLVVFPGGGVSTTAKPFSRVAQDPEWKTFTARLIEQSRAAVAPVYFAGQNSRLFQIASHMSLTLRLSLLFKEVNDRIGTAIDIRVGDVIAPEVLKAIGNRVQMMEYLRSETYKLGKN